MAEFQEVMKQKKRMCQGRGTCLDCPVFKNMNASETTCVKFMEDAPEAAESIIMKWAAENPEPVYPTWVEWWNANFDGDGRRMLTPCSFVSPRELGCSIGHDGCMVAPYKCWHTQIPADIAEKLGIKPVNKED